MFEYSFTFRHHGDIYASRMWRLLQAEFPGLENNAWGNINQHIRNMAAQIAGNDKKKFKQ